MVIVFLEVKLPELFVLWKSHGQTVNYGKIYLGMLMFWGMEFDYGTQAIMVNPPGIIPKSPYLPVSAIPHSLYWTIHVGITK
jgi:hypothetical protein